MIGDLNSDRKLDLVNGNVRANGVSVLLNKGDGSFRAPLDYRIGGYESAKVGDLNSDGKPDLAAANTGPANAVFVALNKPGLCTVQNVKRRRLPTAKRTLVRANCRVGKIRRYYSKIHKRGHVISQKPNFGALLPGGANVNLVVSLGQRG